jgi:hypothetical protein
LPIKNLVNRLGGTHNYLCNSESSHSSKPFSANSKPFQAFAMSCKTVQNKSHHDDMKLTGHSDIYHNVIIKYALKHFIKNFTENTNVERNFLEFNNILGA